MRAAIAGARTVAQTDVLCRQVWRSVGVRDSSSPIGEDAAQALAEALEDRRAELRAMAGGGMERRSGGRSVFPPRRYQRSPDLTASKRLRARLAASGPLPPALAPGFSPGQLAVLRIVADAVADEGQCTAYVEEIGARSGNSRRTVQYALRDAEAAGLIETVERPRQGAPHMTNVVRVVHPAWLEWIKQGQRPGPNGRAQNFAPHGQGYNFDTSAPRPARERAAEGRQAEPVRFARNPPAPAETARAEGGAMPEDHAAVRSDEQVTASINGREVQEERPGADSQTFRVVTGDRSGMQEGDETRGLGPRSLCLSESRDQIEDEEGLDGAPGGGHGLGGYVPQHQNSSVRSGEAGGLRQGPDALEGGRETRAPGLAGHGLAGLRDGAGGRHDGAAIELAGDGERAGQQPGAVEPGIPIEVPRDTDAIQHRPVQPAQVQFGRAEHQGEPGEAREGGGVALEGLDHDAVTEAVRIAADGDDDGAVRDGSALRLDPGFVRGRRGADVGDVRAVGERAAQSALRG